MATTKPALGLSLNNLGNIRISKNNWRGKITPSKNKSFETFKDPADSVHAMIVLIFGYMKNRKAKTVRDIISIYAPATENNVNSYVANILKWTGLKPDDLFAPTKENMKKLLAGMVQNEVGIKPADSILEKAWSESGIVETIKENPIKSSIGVILILIVSVFLINKFA